MESLCDKISRLKTSAESSFANAKKFIPSVYTTDKINVFLNEFDKNYQNCTNTLKNN